MPENLQMELRDIICRSILRVADSSRVVNCVGNDQVCDRDSSITSGISVGMPQFLRTKIGVVLLLLIQADFPERWQTAFDDLMHSLFVRDSLAAPNC